MGAPKNVTSGISGNMRAFELGAFITRGGDVITLDAYLPKGEIFKVLFAPTGGILVIEGVDGVPFVATIQDNGGIPVVGRRVLTNYAFTSGTITTTATPIYWGGGV